MIFRTLLLSGDFFGIPLRVTEELVTKLFDFNSQSHILAFGQKKGRLNGCNKF